MSFARLDNGEYPPLNRENQAKKPDKKKLLPYCQNDEDHIEGIKFKQFVNSARKQRDPNRITIDLEDETSFVKCRVGVIEDEFTDDVFQSLKKNYVGIHCDFILAELEPSRKSFYDGEFQAVPDFALPVLEWQHKVALHIGHNHLDNFDIATAKHIDKIFRHAMYLTCHVILVSCPNSPLAHISMASIINERLSTNSAKLPLVLIRVPIIMDNDDSSVSSWSSQSTNSSKRSAKKNKKYQVIQLDETNSESEFASSATKSAESGYTSIEDKVKVDPWLQWNSIRDHLIPDRRIGVALEIDDELSSCQEELDRWLGEPIRMLIIDKNQFIRTPGYNGALYLNQNCRNFIRKVAVANSFRVSLVLKGSARGAQDYLTYLDFMAQQLQDELRDNDLVRWDTVLQTPLQPLSTNLDAGTYGTFEADSIKYERYGEAICEAVKHKLSLNPKPQSMVLMVLGAGRGPLVDRTIEAIESLNTECKFKIYALDKNPSSVLTLKYRREKEWSSAGDLYRVEVVEADMREWKPDEKPDIITTELLGSFGDNELSPECIDGLWRFSTPNTISIPQEYTSYLAPVCSYKLFQKINKLRKDTPYAFDQLYVTRMINSYLISAPEKLFQFSHKDLTKKPVEDQNARYAKLTFWSKTNTVCHGFAGYFSAQLFGGVNLSTVPGKETINMYSWFPIFIPIERAIQMSRGERLEVHFWRKESASQVWYQWGITHPIRSRIYSQNGLNTAMSKSI